MRRFFPLIAALALAQPLSAQTSSLAVSYDPASYRPTVTVGPVLQDRELEQAARSGLPVRVRIRIELWRDRFFDELVDSTSWSTIVGYEPIGEIFYVRSMPGPDDIRTFSSYTAARASIETEFRLGMQPGRTGRFYYTASLAVETLSVSDLEELERWLQGELQPAVSGRRSVPGALGQGARRLMLRILDLPTYRYDARTGRFTVN